MPPIRAALGSTSGGACDGVPNGADAIAVCDCVEAESLAVCVCVEAESLEVVASTDESEVDIAETAVEDCIDGADGVTTVVVVVGFV